MLRAIVPIAFLLFPFPVAAIEQSFSDVPQTREEFVAVEDLRRRGIVEGRPDGTFGPNEFVNRAEAVTIVVRAVANIRNLPSRPNCFPDVREGQWFVKQVCYAKDLEWVRGYPDGTFQPARTVSKVEFLKILLHAYGVDTGPIEDAWHDPLAGDAANPQEWYFPYLSYALASSMTRADASGNLNPGAALTRGQVALLVHRLILYREGERGQALLTEAEKDIRLTFEKLDALEVSGAQYATARVRLRAWGASQRLPDAPIVRATTKLGEALSALVQAYRRVQVGKLDEALAQAQEAYRLADATDTLHPDVRVYTDRVRTAAHILANAIREQQR